MRQRSGEERKGEENPLTAYEQRKGDANQKKDLLELLEFARELLEHQEREMAASPADKKGNEEEAYVSGPDVKGP